MIDKEYKNKVFKIFQKEKEISTRIHIDIEHKILEEFFVKLKSLIQKSSDLLFKAGKLDLRDKFADLPLELSSMEYNQLKENMSVKELSLLGKRTVEFVHAGKKFPIDYNLKLNDMFGRIYRPFYNCFRKCEENEEILKEIYEISDLVRLFVSHLV